MMLRFERVVATGSVTLDSGIGDTALETFNGVTYLYSLTGPTGGIASWRLASDGTTQLQDTAFFDPSISLLVGRSGTSLELGGSDKLVLDVRTATGLVSYDLESDGTIGALRETSGLSGGGNITAVAQASFGGTDILAVAHEDTGRIGTYHVSGDGSLSLASTVTASVDSMQILASGAQQFVVGADSVTNTIATFRIDQGSGTLSAIDNSAAIQTVGIAAPTALEAVQAYGQSWVIFGGATSNSLSVMRLSADGRLSPTDHVLDTLHTRFETVQDIALVEVDGQVFVVAGGGDDGVSLFVLTPHGKLVHMDSFADTLDSGLQNVQTLSVAHIGDELQIFAAAQQDSGLTQLSASVADMGIVVDGFGTVSGSAGRDILSGSILDSNLQGGAGDDILIAGKGATTMTGGAGADIFVMQSGSETTTITDFETGTDRLDLFDYLLLRTPSQLDFTSTAWGARIGYRDEEIDVYSASETSLTSAQVFGAGFEGPDHFPVNLFGSGPSSSGGVLGPITVDSQTANPALSDAEVNFTLNGGAEVSVTADSEGRFDLDLPSGSFSGSLDIVKTYSAASSEITALDALQVLRIAVGLGPTWGPATSENLIAADINKDGLITAFDALTVLKVAVGLPTQHEAEWIFLDSDQDLSGLSATNVHYTTGIETTVTDGALTADMTSILLGNIEAV